MNKQNCQRCSRKNLSLISVLSRRPNAIAVMYGGDEYPDISGAVKFYQTQSGTVVYAEINGLDKTNLPCEKRFYAFHIHSGGDCGGMPDSPFEHAMLHYNPDNCEHPHHAGDLPPLLSTGSGTAVCAFLTDRFTVSEIIGKTLIIHKNSDDFKTQPSGGSGEKIACGVMCAI